MTPADLPPVLPHTPPTAWWVRVVVSDEHYGFLNWAGGITAGSRDGTVAWFDTREAAGQIAEVLRQEGRDVVVLSNARY